MKKTLKELLVTNIFGVVFPFILAGFSLFIIKVKVSLSEIVLLPESINFTVDSGSLHFLLLWIGSIFLVASIYLLFRKIRNIICNYKDSKQIRNPGFSFVPGSDYKKDIHYVFDGNGIAGYKVISYTKWIGSSDIFLKVQEIVCPNKNCFTELTITQTFFHNYKYRCVSCGYSFASDKNQSTLKKIKEKEFYGDFNRERFGNID